MNIIGINAYHADSSACLLSNGKLIAAVEEERLNRTKIGPVSPLNQLVIALILEN